MKGTHAFAAVGINHWHRNEAENGNADEKSS